MRVVHLTPSYAPAWRFGGPIESTHQLCRALLSAGVEVRVLTTNVGQAGEAARGRVGHWGDRGCVCEVLPWALAGHVLGFVCKKFSRRSSAKLISRM